MNTNALFAAALAITAPAALIQQAEAASASETIAQYKELVQCSQEIESLMAELSTDPLRRDATCQAVLIYGVMLREHEVGLRITRSDLSKVPSAQLKRLADCLKRSREATALYAKRILAYQENEYARIPVLVAITSGYGLVPENARQREFLKLTAGIMYTQGLQDTFDLISDMDTELIETRPNVDDYPLDCTLLQLQRATEGALLYLQRMNPEEAARVKRLNEEMLQKLKKDAIEMRRDNYHHSTYLREFCRSYGQ